MRNADRARYAPCMSPHYRHAAFATLVALSGCAADEALHAGINTAMHVGATAAYVAASDGCWGDCMYGTHCDKASSVCVPDEEAALAPASDPADPLLQTAPIPSLRPHGEPMGVCEVSGGACVDEGAVCTLAHDECVGQCRCLGLTWQCLESCR